MENILIAFLRKFTDYPFLVKMDGKEYLIGEGEPTFTVVFKEPISKHLTGSWRGLHGRRPGD